jgi:hypothetical protein
MWRTNMELLPFCGSVFFIYNNDILQVIPWPAEAIEAKPVWKTLSTKGFLYNANEYLNLMNQDGITLYEMTFMDLYTTM